MYSRIFFKREEKKKKAKKPKADLTAEVANQFSWLWSQETAEFPARLQIGYKIVITLLSSKARPQNLPSSKESQANKSSPKQVEYAPHFQEFKLVSVVAVQVFPCAGCSV